MGNLKTKFAEKALPLADEMKKFAKENGNVIIGNVEVEDIFSGMKGITGLLTETSLLDAQEGIRFRGYSIPELRAQLPKIPGGTEPLPEGLFYLMLIGDFPTYNDVLEIQANWRERSKVPAHVFKTLDALPINMHPMTQLSIGIMAMQTESVFAKAYQSGINKKDYWDYTYEDVCNLLARLPQVAAYIYRRTYKNSEFIEPNHNLDWAANFAHMMGYENPLFHKMMRLYLTIHADHEGGNVSAHTTHLVGSALSDPYLSLAAAMNGLAGPLHGLANQEVIRWIIEMRNELGGGLPTKEQIADYIHKTLAAGKVVPGYGHAVLRKTDPRFIAQQDFAKQYMPDDELVNIVWRIYEVAPPILEATGKIKNPWPNVDAHSGALLLHYGFAEYEFYTVLFGVSRALGVLASLLWDRALGMPIERPKSITFDALKKLVNDKKATA
ncbi:MAG: citrate (Si)-synthase, eukaryotic [Bacteroidia bacterium]